ncbi:MAG: glutamate synthase, partial [Campylobacterota bacterium]|nr:glutamate synthase [Campylobacterota bacterium]
MGKVTGFKEFERKNFTLAPVEERVKHYNEFTTPLNKADMEDQAARCMDCGVP